VARLAGRKRSALNGEQRYGSATLVFDPQPAADAKAQAYGGCGSASGGQNSRQTRLKACMQNRQESGAFA